MSITWVLIQAKSVHPFRAGCKSDKDYLRYALWLGVAGTAAANQRHFRLPTTWIPHLPGNTASLLLPEIYRLVNDRFNLEERLFPDQHPTWEVLQATFQDLVLDNPDYVEYVAPVALGYIVSHPDFNIYRGEWAELKIWGFGLDTIPHSTTAYALTKLIYDAIEVLDANAPVQTPIRPYVTWATRNKALLAGGVLAALTLGYETGEYLIHKYELRKRNYDTSRINMVWGLGDSVFDGLSNAIGWALAALRLGR